MIVTITQFKSLARDQNGATVPLGDRRVACEARTSDGAFGALASGTKFVRIATDTPIRVDIDGGDTDTSDELFLPGVEYISARAGMVLTIAEVS